MQTDPKFTESVTHRTIALSLRAPDSPVRHQMSGLCRLAPPPFDFPLLLQVTVGESAAANAALALLQQPNSAAATARDQFKSLSERCIQEYEARPGCVDAEDALEGRLRTYPAWALLSAIGAPDSAVSHPAVQAAGIELLLSFHHGKPMAAAFCSGARVAIQAKDLDGTSLQALMEQQVGEALPHWLRHARSRFAEFLSIYDDVPPAPIPPRSFEDSSRTQLVSRAAFANYRRRAGILDDTCFSRRQIAEASAYAASGVFRTSAERRAAMWLVGCSGLYATSTQFIPLASTSRDDWVLDYDLQTGILRRDFSCLAPEAARPRPGSDSPASFVSCTPAPVEVRDELLRRAAMADSPGDIGDLIPALRSIQPRDLVYPDLADLAPSFARWSRTLAPLALQVGIDALLAAVTTGDFGITARSKIHYCLLSPEELWRSAERLYEALGWGKPVPMPTSLMAFGAAVVPSEAALRRIDDELCSLVEKLRPPHRLSGEAQLLEFHNRFVRTLAWRLAAWLSLREAAEFSLRASIDERFDLCIDVVEKASAGRVGGMPAVACDELRSALRNYRHHCEAMRERLRTFGWSGAAVDWLAAVVSREDVPLLCTIRSRDRVLPVGTDELRKHLPGVGELAKDWGRKFAENRLRLAGVQTRDIDRHQRHDVLGQEQDTSIADGIEVDWARRLQPALSAMSRVLFRGRLNGLRAGEYAQ
ncbi:hypothetical protein [uncultured Piscinibacter sp.]|uniref:hypothetical protein n=1 Tax=uncultured Piscinibacter sp. TaxID=1131835 RepID=UPI00262C8C5D|nr:hypothetical protein [uncultured Piscinibacter sp.]